VLRPEVVIARRLRREMTLPEVLLWQRLKGAKSGAKFRRQHPIGPYVADFYCSEARLVVEVDGQVHEGARAKSDLARQRFLEENGYQVVRVPAADISGNPDAVAASIAAFAARPLHQPPAGPPPRSGEDQE
jgi:very-short-patch-repair endonuclease